ncbi:hypothetical protein A374_02699 [Fictibacillus macauensis ZFHKF-1]|uniref:Uncharacterized protein n=2 Tax=Fictibacillus TaxID=1329200 RepID=I8AMD3_9BACL|nr:hypothetical protein [Fictibacillus macauensis]EIT87127.1 hypothetical protein A374_02699 [Fictibacillus macauensis ZFHKF-1]
MLMDPTSSYAGQDILYPLSNVPSKGVILPWREAQEILPRGSKFTVTDWKTGLSFNVQRRAGSSHADVQPLTVRDTKIMKQLYDGKWSWKRRAILIQKNERWLAASMNGMPHGQGALQNGFPGHFCIHFSQSTTHKSKHEDPSHQLMIRKAGGSLFAYARKASPEEVITMLFASIKEGDPDLAAPVVTQKISVLPLGKQLAGFRYEVVKKKHSVQSDLTATYDVKTVLYPQHGGQIKNTYSVTVEKAKATAPWQVTDVALK